MEEPTQWGNISAALGETSRRFGCMPGHAVIDIEITRMVGEDDGRSSLLHGALDEPDDVEMINGVQGDVGKRPERGALEAEVPGCGLDIGVEVVNRRPEIPCLCIADKHADMGWCATCGKPGRRPPKPEDLVVGMSNDAQDDRVLNAVHHVQYYTVDSLSRFVEPLHTTLGGNLYSQRRGS